MSHIYGFYYLALQVFLLKISLIDALNDICGDNFFASRSHCMDNGKYVHDHDDETGAMSTTATGFYSYSTGRWKQNLDISHDEERGHGWYWDLPEPCSLKRMNGQLFCDIMHQIHANHPESDSKFPRLALVGDSITLLQTNLLAGQLFASNMSKTGLGKPGVQHICGVQMKFDRADKLLLKKRVNETTWIQNICNSDVAVINFGAHAAHIEDYLMRIVAARDALLSVCGKEIAEDKIKVYFRTTVEGNPLCYASRSHYKLNNSMTNWNNIIWPVISGNMSPEYKQQLNKDINDKTLFFRSEAAFYEHRWHWELFQNYNEIASRELSNTNIRIMDVVALSRLRPTIDWAKPEKLDCLHTNRGATEWNTMLMNVLATELCSAQK